MIAGREPALWPIAFHEAGHAVVAWSRGIKVTSATIVPARDFLGQVTQSNPLRGVRLDYDGSNRARLRAEAVIVVLLAGPVAERRHDSRLRRSRYGAHDHERAADLAMRVNGSDKAAEAHLNWLAIVARDEIDASWDLVERVARKLFEQRTLSAAEIAACCRERFSRPLPQPDLHEGVR
jgi:hypothetical protein